MFSEVGEFCEIRFFNRFFDFSESSILKSASRKSYFFKYQVWRYKKEEL